MFPKELQHGVSGEVGGDPGPHVERRVHLREVEPDHVAVLGDGREGVAQLRVGHPVRLRRHAPGNERQVPHVDVDAHMAVRAR